MRACVRAYVCCCVRDIARGRSHRQENWSAFTNSGRGAAQPFSADCRVLSISRPDSSVFTDFSEDFTHERILIRGAKAMREVAAVLQWSRAERQMITGLQ